jgi:YVTN family beta-propeller protein
MVYVADEYRGNVTVINGGTNTIVTQVAVGSNPSAVAVNTSTNMVYVANFCGSSVSVISGVTNAVVATVTVGTIPMQLQSTRLQTRFMLRTQVVRVCPCSTARQIQSLQQCLSKSIQTHYRSTQLRIRFM